VVPLLLLFCVCGGAAAAANFKTIAFDAKEHLIAYNTEGQGEDKVGDPNPLPVISNQTIEMAVNSQSVFAHNSV